MAKKTLIRLALDLDFQAEEQYYQYCADSYINGQHDQCKELFNAMKHQDKHGLIKWLRENIGNDEIHNFYVNLF